MQSSDSYCPPIVREIPIELFDCTLDSSNTVHVEEASKLANKVVVAVGALEQTIKSIYCSDVEIPTNP